MEKHSTKYRQLGLNIAYYRKKNGLTQEDLAKKVQISRTHMSGIEALGVSRNPSLDLLFDIADTLNIEISSLFESR